MRHLRQRRVFRRDFVKESFPPPSWGKWCKENWDGSSGICREWGVALAFPPLSEALVETDELPDAFVMDILGEKAAASARDPLENEIVAGAATASCIAVANGARSPLHWNTLRRGLLHLDSGTQERVYRELQRSPCDSRALLEVHRANAGVTFGGDGGSPSAQSVTSAGATSPVKLQALRRYLIATTKDSHEAAIDPSSLLRRLPRKQRPGFVYEMCLHQSMWNDRFESDLWAELMNRDRDPDPDLRLACARALWQRYRGPSAKARPEFGKNRKRLLAAVLSWYAEPLVDVQQRARIAERAIRVVDWEHSPTGQTLDFLEKILELLRESTGPSSAQVDDAQQMLRRAFMPLWQEGRSHAFYVERTGKEAPSVFSAACLAGRWQPRSRDSAETLERMQSRLRENRPLEAIDLYERVPLWMSRIDEKNGTVDPIAKHSSCLYASALVDVGEAKKALVILGRYDDLEIDLSDKDLASVCLFARGHAYRVDGRPDLAIDDFRSAEGMGEDYRFWSEVQHAWARAELLSSCLKNPDSEKLKCSYISDGYEFQKETIAMFERHEENRRSLWEERGCGEGSRVQSPSSECDSIKIDADVLDGWAYSYDNGTEQGASDAIEFIDREIGRFDGDLGYSVVEARLENRKGYFCHELLGQTYKAHIAFQKAKDIVVKWGADDRERFPVVEGVVLNYMESALLYKEFDEVVALSRLLERRSDRETANGAMNVIFRFLALAGQRAQGKPVDVEVLADACLSAWHAYEGFPADSGWKFNGSRKYIARRSASLAGRDKGLDKYFGALDGVFLALEKPGSWEGKRALGAEFRTWTVGRDPVFFLEHEWKWARRSSDGDALEAEVDEALGSSPVLSWESPERFVPVLLRRGGNSGFGSVVGIEMTCSARWDEEEEVVPVE